MKIYMPPRRRLLSWPGSRMLPRRCLPSWLGWQLHVNGGGVLVDAGLAVALLMPSARVLPGTRQGSCRGVAAIPGKGLVDFLGWDPAEGRRLLVLIRSHM